ncbi:MAG TPA: hydantoinase/oxoprolinase family protein, partial [Pseudomonadales bacterium]|nr:hydantoinase/oxoprolinase family protein [Pseudomonadales bacterium]
MMVLGIDTGGTFTDFVLFDGERLHIHKVLSTPEAPDEAIATGMAELGLEAPLRQGKLLLVHGSTVATNAALEGKGVPTLFVTNRGFRDLLTIGRQIRRELYELMPAPLPPPVPAELCFEVDTRRDHLGRLITPLTDADLTRLRHAIATLAPQAVAICLLYSFMDESEEQALAAALPPGLFVSCSSQVLPEYREYERGIATWLNSWLGPLVSDYLGRLSARTAPAPLTIMQSSGGTVAAEQARQRAVNLLLSGPAGGMAAARHLADTLGERQLITFDMGGTSTDVGLLSGGELTLTNEGRIGPYPVAVPMVDLHTIGAGGGSIAFLDDGGGLWVGPRSAGALPGPACYGRGGREPTVTDANLLLGRLRPERFLGGAMPLDVAAAQRAIATLADPLGLSLEETAAGIIEIANEQMIRALRLISVERGHDPRQFRLCCFGGAGGLHLCRLAEALGIRRAL